MSGRRALALCFALAAAPAALFAEGAERVFDCTGEDGASTRFTVAPVALDADGKGDIRVTRDGASFEGMAASARGPFQFWSPADTFTLIVEGPAEGGKVAAKLHHVALTADPATPFAMTMTPFTCETDD